MSRIDPAYTGPINPADPVPDGESLISIYGYTPSLAFAAIACATFGAVLGVHVSWLVLGKGTRLFQGLFCFGCLMEIVGYSFRARSSNNPFVVVNFILQYFMIVCAPVFYTTSLYLALLKAVRRLQPSAMHITPISPKKMLVIFAVIDVTTTALQIVGAALIGVTQSARAEGRTPPLTTDAANNILLAGLVIQNFSFIVFLGLFGVIVHRNSKLPRTSSSASGYDDEGQRALGGPSAEKGHDSDKTSEGHDRIDRLPTMFNLVLVISSLFLLLRTLYRLAETAEGVWGFARTSEGLFGGLEYAPVIIALALWAIFPLYKMLQPRKRDRRQ